MGENIQLHWGVSRVWAPTLDLLEDEERRVLDISILQASILRQMAFPWARLPSRLVEDRGEYQTTVEMPEAYLDALDELELMLGGGYIPPEGAVVGERFVDRGDPVAFDVTTSGLILDQNWHGLSLAPFVVDADATRVLLMCRFYSSSVGKIVSFRRGSNSNAFNMAEARTQTANYYEFLNCEVVLGDARVIDYRVSSGMAEVSIAVRGWWIPAA